MPSKNQASVIFRRYRRGPDGGLLDAHDYGYRAWPIRIRGKDGGRPKRR
jgi:hypothetical protein